MKNWLVMLTLLKGRVMSKYVAGKDYQHYKNFKEKPRLLTRDASWYDKKQLIETVIKIIHGERRRRQLTKIFSKLTKDEIIVLEGVFRIGAQKEAESNIKNVKETTR